MKSYEGIFIFSPEVSPEVRKTQVDQLDEIIKKFQGTIVQKTELGKKSLGYGLRKFKEGYFFIYDFRINPLKMIELRNALELQEDLLKFMLTVKREVSAKLPEAHQPSASTQARPAAVSH